MAAAQYTTLGMIMVTRICLFLRAYTLLILAALLQSCATIESSQTVVMEIPSGDCGSSASRSATDYKWHYKWQKGGLLVVSGALPEGGSSRVKRGSARITQRGNLLVIAYENYELARELDKEGREMLPTVCAWRIPVTFSIRELEGSQYYLIVGRESGEIFRVMTSLVIDEPSE
jgi:hypothetical protein